VEARNEALITRGTHSWEEIRATYGKLGVETKVYSCLRMGLLLTLGAWEACGIAVLAARKYSKGNKL